MASKNLGELFLNVVFQMAGSDICRKKIMENETEIVKNFTFVMHVKQYIIYYSFIFLFFWIKSYIYLIKTQVQIRFIWKHV